MIGSLFSGIGGLELGLERAGLGPVAWQAECEPYAQAVLRRHWPKAKLFDRVEDVGHGAARVRLICGGFPCQDISPAGKRAGLAGAKSGLWREFERVVGELRPGWVVVENNGHRWRAWVPHVRRALHALGYASLPLRLRASDLGAWHQRTRIFLAANRDGDLVRLQQRGRLRACWAAAVQSARARAPWLPAYADNQGQLQPSWGIREDRGRPGDGGGRTIEPALARGVHGVPNRVERERALGNAVVPACAEAVGLLITSAILERKRKDGCDG